jgi:hypothetical protein
MDLNKKWLFRRAAFASNVRQEGQRWPLHNAAGRFRTTSFSCKSTKSTAATDRAQRVLNDADRLVAALKVHQLGSPPRGAGNLN